MKKLFGILVVISLCLILTSCKMLDYNDAKNALDSHNYEDAINIFAELGNYRDSQDQLYNGIENYAAKLSNHHDYDKLISLYQQYSYAADFSNQMQDAVIKYSNHLMNRSKFVESIAVYSQYSTIADFSAHQQSAIEEAVCGLLSDDDYETAISIYQQYSDIADYSSQIAELQSEKELFDIYVNAMDLLKNGYINKGLSTLDSLPENYREVEQIYSSYYSLKDSPFKGSHKMKNPDWTNSQKVEFSLVFLPEYECFCIQADLTVYWSDGTVYSKDTYHGYADDLKDNVLKTGRYKWIVSSSGRITQKD